MILDNWQSNLRMIKIQPQIKVRSSRTQSEGTYFDRKNENYDKDRKMSYQEHRKDAQILEIELSLQPTYPTTVQEDLTALSTNNMFRVSSSKFPFGGDNCSIVPPPSPFRAIIDIDNGIVTKENKVRQVKVSIECWTSSTLFHIPSNDFWTNHIKRLTCWPTNGMFIN